MATLSLEKIGHGFLSVRIETTVNVIVGVFADIL